jgi:hypothetical protein
VRNFFLNLFVIEILYTLSICLTKFSILLFYWRIFGSTTIRIPIYTTAALVTGWGIGVVCIPGPSQSVSLPSSFNGSLMIALQIVTTILQCEPVHGFWDRDLNPVCGVNVNNFFIGNAVPNIVTDWALLFLPLPYIWRLQRNTVQKLAIYASFLLGGL